MKWYTKVLLFGPLVLAFWLVAVVAYWLIAPYDLLSPDPATGQTIAQFVAEPVPVYTSSVMQGSSLVYGRRFCVTATRYDFTVSREFVDGVRYMTPTVAPTWETGCHEGRVIVTVPMLPPGTYHLQSTVTFHVNPLRDRIYVFQSQPFEVKERRRGVAN